MAKREKNKKTNLVTKKKTNLKKKINGTGVSSLIVSLSSLIDFGRWKCRWPCFERRSACRMFPRMTTLCSYVPEFVFESHVFSLEFVRKHLYKTLYPGLDPLDFQSVFRLDDDNLPSVMPLPDFRNPSVGFRVQIQRDNDDIVRVVRPS